MHAGASRRRNVFLIVPLDPTLSRFGGTGHLPVKSLFWRRGNLGAKDGERMEIDHLSQREG